MAEKMIFISSEESFFEEAIIEYKYYSGFALSQKRKCIHSLHESIKRLYPGKSILEISTKSDKDEGVRSSAFNLLFYQEELGESRHIENVFQAAKVFENGGPYIDLLDVAPKDAKRDPRLVESGQLVCFDLNGKKWPLIPKTMFYDWIYITSLKQNMTLAKQLLKYDIFTDIEYNHKRSLNCQARAAAIFVSLYRKNMLDELTESPERFKSIYTEIDDTDQEQISFL